MKPFVRPIAFFFSALLVLCGTASCIFKRDYGDPENDGKVLFVLHVAPVSTRADGGINKVTEKIRSLRVIAIGERGIELNEKKTFENAVSAQELSYFFSWYTDAGKKDFYLFANEESVQAIQFTDNQRPTGLGDHAKLGDLLNLDRYAATPGEDSSFKEVTKASGSGGTAETRADKAAAEQFKTVINSLFFSPDYRIENQEIYLPYSVFYGDVNLKGGSPIEKTMYLVPVATKFTFSFQNYRTQEVEVKEIKVSPIHSQNFLLGRVAENEQTKPFNSHPDEPEKNEMLYWVDWLAKVSEESQRYPGTSDNSDINTRYGWISDYVIPPHEGGPSVFVSDSDEPACTIPAGKKTEEEEVASSLTIGPFYRPESRHEGTEQQYLLTLRLHDTSQNSDKDPLFEDVVIENLRSLFRTTQVIINVTLRQGNVEVYAEIAPWNEKKANGWVIEGEAPKS